MSTPNFPDFKDDPSVQMADALLEFGSLFESLVDVADGIRSTMARHGYSDTAAEYTATMFLNAQIQAAASPAGRTP